MACGKTFRFFHSSFSSLRSSLFPSSLHRYPSAAQSFSSAARSTAVEHVVLFKFRDFADQFKIDAVMSGVRSLMSLDVVAHITAGPVLSHRSAAAGFTHLLHGRYRSKDDLAAYSAHPAHVAVVEELGRPILEDILAVDWVADLDGPMAPPPGSAMRLTLAKPKEGAESELKEMLAKAKASALASAPTVGTQVSFGENFSPVRAKGYGVGLLAVFPSLEELDAMDAREKNRVDSLEEKFKPLLESSIVLDFVVPPPSTDDL
ncbi:stress-response A/B barrel domain-containing protein UP3-like [Curcuma longa]|uniref:stress-response A/B barrel domain-containing protein UP3-like n=1 Tax=Curcuma longa TaxID=136217 RepID=UPI003D9E1A16